MTQQFENFVNAALDKSLASDVTLPTANEIPVYTGIGRQVTGKTTAELGLAALVDGKVPASQLPSYVDDVLEYPNLASFPVTGESGKVYVALDTNKTYRWSGSTYVVIGSDLALGETLSTAYRGDKGKTAYDHSQATGNPHGATTDDITDSTDKRYVTDTQRTRVNTAASSSDDGYLTSTDWTTFNGKLGLADVRYQFVSDANATYIVPASAVTAVGNTIIELSNPSLTSITVNAATATGKTVGDFVYVSITGTYYAAQALVAGAGVTLQGDLTFSYPHQTKCLIFKGTNTWKVVG